MRVSSDMPDDVIVLHDALLALREHKKGEPLTLHLKNCGTALRFLQVHLQAYYPGEPITLDGDPRLKERDGKPTSQTDSAWLMHGREVTNPSPYVAMTRRVMETYPNVPLEKDWSASSFWYEYVAVHGGELLLEGLTADSIQGDRVVADIFAEFFGVETTFTAEGAKIINHQSSIATYKSVSLNFERIPDLYPPIALACERLGIELHATGTERLRYKESDRLEAVRLHQVRNDHRIAMSLMAADFPVSIEDQACIAKSYPTFTKQFAEYMLPKSRQGRHRHGNDTATTRQREQREQYPTCDHIVPIKGVNDDNMGKKHALSKLIHASNADYIWLHDDDVVSPEAVNKPFDSRLASFDLIILPLRMESSPSLLGEGRGEASSLLERLQIAEYAAIQELTMRTAKLGRAVMCSGANLIVRREAWLACEPDLHPEIPSGDDMFLLEAAKRRGLKIGVIDEADYTAIVRPQATWRAFWHQRMRWAGKAPHYTDRDIRRCGALVLTANLLQLLCPPVILIKFPIELALIKKREPQTSWLVALLLEIVYPFYLLLSLLGGLFRQQSW